MHTKQSQLISVLVVALCIATVFVWSLVYAVTPSDILTVAFLDVGQGDALYIQTPNGTQALIDGGKGMAAVRALGSHMPAHDHSIDVVLATHPDLDHIGGLPAVFERYTIGMFIESGVRDEGADNTALHRAVQHEGLSVVRARSGTTLMLDEGVALSFLFPEGDVSQFEANTGSIVARLTYGDISFVLTGDAPQSIERYLTGRYGTALKSNVLKLGHHGSDTSTSAEFLGAVLPTYGVVSAGCDNPYGHPHKNVLDRLAQFNVQTLTTCTEGTVVFETDGITLLRR